MDDPRIDLIVRDPRLAPYSGWHDDYPAGTAAYLPAIQQDRAEFLAFLREMVGDDVFGVLDGRALVLGLGIAGGMHLVFDALFRRGVVTIDNDWPSIDGLLRRKPPLRMGSTIIEGRFSNRRVIYDAYVRAPYSLIFIDGTHSYEEVSADFRNYTPFVEAGGVIAFHDVNETSYPEVARFVKELQQSYAVHIVEPFKLGIAWIRA